MNYVLIFCNSTAGRLIYAHSHYNMCAGGGYMYQISNEIQTHFACCHIVNSLEDGKILIQELRLILGENPANSNLHAMYSSFHFFHHKIVFQA